MTDRRVHHGVLGCPNCRDSFEISDGFADMRAPPRTELGAGLAGEPERPAAADEDRVLALLGIARGPATVATLGPAVVFASSLAESIDDAMVVAVDADTRHWPSHPGVSRMAAGPGLPFFDRTLRGAVVDGRVGAAMIFEACRCVAPMSRVVVLGADTDTSRVIEEAGLSVLAAEAQTIVAARG